MDANEPAHGEVGVEPSGVATKPILSFGIALAILTVVSMAVVAALFLLLERRSERRDDSTVAAAGLQLRERRLPPGPLLQVHPERHWEEYKASELAILEGYGWSDRGSGAVHIPIERAMDLIAARGVAPLANAPAPTPLPTVPPGFAR
jgi:hypothetical protein